MNPLPAEMPRGEREKIAWYSGPAGQAGAVLIGLIITMVILSVLGAAMISQTTSQSFHLMGANLADQAYYLAESGYRYAAAKLQRGEDIDGLHDHEYPVGDRGGSFRLMFSTYVFEVAATSNVSVLEIKVPFGMRPDWPNVAGNLVFDDVGTLTPFDAVDMSDADQQVIRFIKTAGNWLAEQGQRPKLGAPSSGYNGTGVSGIGPGGELLVGAEVELFPSRNGRFTLAGQTYRYRKTDHAQDKLMGVTMADPNAAWVTPPGSGTIVLDSFLLLRSIGKSSAGISREIAYSIPLDEKREFHDRFEDKSHWEETSSLGDHAVATVGGDKVLKVIQVVSTPDRKSSLIAFKPETSGVDLARRYGAAGRYLSYDTQVKIGFDPTSVPEGGFDPVPIPKYFAAGISLRLNNNADCYGVSFLRGNQNLFMPLDGIDNAIVPMADTPMIVLWQQTNFGTVRKWLAYKKLTPVTFFTDNMESGTVNWNPDPPWARVGNHYHSASNCWHDSPGGNYADNQSITLTSKPLNLKWEQDVELVFWHRYDLEFAFDFGYVEISSDISAGFDPLTDFTNGWFFGEVPQTTWVEQHIPIPAAYLKENVRIRFRLETDFSVQRDGWYIDDVKILSNYYPLPEAGLVVRLQEAASIQFTNGTGPIQAGDILTQAGGAAAVVVGTPLLSSGAWGGSAAGTILLNRLAGGTPFGAGPLEVGGVQQATGVSGSFRTKDNYIRVYYGDKTGYGTPDSILLNMERKGNPRCTSACNSLNWPSAQASGTTPENDYFTLVQWEAVNGTVGTVAGMVDLAEPNAVVRSHQAELLSPIAGFSAQPELGLHAYGNGALNVYFDDFGLRADVARIAGFLPAIQE